MCNETSFYRCVCVCMYVLCMHVNAITTITLSLFFAICMKTNV